MVDAAMAVRAKQHHQLNLFIWISKYVHTKLGTCIRDNVSSQQTKRREQMKKKIREKFYVNPKMGISRF